MRIVAGSWFVIPENIDKQKEIKRMEKNPKMHDSLFKWLIASFTEQFFEHYFPDIRVGKYTCIDKEFIQKYEALKESLRGDLFLTMEVEIDGALQEIVIQIEHKSERRDVVKRVYKYSCYAWLLKEKPVWSIVIYTDDAVWRKPVPDSYWFAFDSRNKKQLHTFDVIKIKAEKSADLIKKHSMLCKLLALKANDKGMDPERLIREIYRTASEMKHLLTDEQLLLIEQWVNAYKKVSDRKATEIKKEVKMGFIATTIKEHIQYKSKNEGKIEGKIETLEGLHAEGVLSKEQFEKKVSPLRRELRKLLRGNDGRKPVESDRLAAAL